MKESSKKIYSRKGEESAQKMVDKYIQTKNQLGWTVYDVFSGRKGIGYEFIIKCVKC